MRRKTLSVIAIYEEAVDAIKTAILQSQLDAVKTVNEKQLKLYYAGHDGHPC